MTFTAMDYAGILKSIADDTAPLQGEGRVATYIPELACMSPHHFGMALITLPGECFAVGDAHLRFSLQSISKVLTLVLAIQRVGEHLFERVGREPSGNPFNSLVQLEYEHGIPRNPFINAGALVVTDVLLEHLSDPTQAVLDLARQLGGNNDISYDEAVAHSERQTGFTNRALAHFLKAQGNLRHDPDQVLEVYFQHCSLRMSCLELARSFLFLANRGQEPASGKRLLTVSQAKRLNALMLTCGFYDEAGEFAFRVGLPGKSGVGGGIAAILPGRWAVAVWSPEINACGNSVRGMKALELLTTRTGESIF